MGDSRQIMPKNNGIPMPWEIGDIILFLHIYTHNVYGIHKPYLEKYSNIHYRILSQNSGPAAAQTEALKRTKGQNPFSQILSLSNHSNSIFVEVCWAVSCGLSSIPARTLL